MHALDLSTFYLFFNLSGKAALLDWCIVFCAEYLLYVLVAIVFYYLLVAWRWGQWGRVYDYCVAVLVALVARFCVAEVIRHFYLRPRPYTALHLSRHLLSDNAYSFPSGHTIFLFALATGIYKINKKLGLWLYGLGVLVGLARVAAGVHYPSDILGGMLLGVCVGYVGYTLWELLQKSINIPRS